MAQWTVGLMTVMGLCRCLLGSMVVLQNGPTKKDLASHPEPSAQLGIGSAHVGAFRPTAPLALAVAPPAILDRLRAQFLRISNAWRISGNFRLLVIFVFTTNL